MPFLKTANADHLARAARTAIGADKSPVIFRLVLGPQVIPDYAKIWKRRHKGLRHVGDRFPPDGRRVIVDTKRVLIRVEFRHTRGIVAAPCRGIARRKIAQIE